MVWFGLVFFCYQHSWLFNVKAILVEERQWPCLTHNWRDKGDHAFPKGISPEVNVMALQEFELAYFKVTVQHFNHCAWSSLPYFLNVRL